MMRSRIIGFAVLVLSGCGMGAEWDRPGLVECTDGRTLDLREWTPYVPLTSGTKGWLENKRTGERIEDDGTVKCHPK